ncbi:MAG: hypothetical protein WBB46_03840, partial [Candidatus Deferrimicrobiaceae bacterium]
IQSPAWEITADVKRNTPTTANGKTFFFSITYSSLYSFGCYENASYYRLMWEGLTSFIPDID